MPFYEYECQSCKFYTEVMQKITDVPLTKCPSCGKKALQKLVSAPNFRLKGGGWYETDFKGDKENKRNLHGGEKDEAPAKEESKTAAPAEGAKGESPKAPAAAAESKPEPKASAGTGRSSGGRAAPSGRRTPKPPARAASGKSRPAAARGRSSKAVGRKKRR